jgi:hypothetical protein
MVVCAEFTGREIKDCTRGGACICAIELLRNSCDGCCAGHSLQNGLHIDETGKPYMVCQAHKYKLKGGYFGN